VTQCIRCKTKNIISVDEKKNLFEFQSRGNKMVVKRRNAKSTFFCLECLEEFEASIPKPKNEKVILDCLFVHIDFADWEFKETFRSEKGKGVIWLEVYNGKSQTYLCKVWGSKLINLIDEREFQEGSVWTGELRFERNQKDGKKDQSVCFINFNESSVNIRDEE
jgi:hypothetical protein